MHTKVSALFVSLVIFSLQVFSQATKTSSHPLLDKYYPRKEPDTTAAQVKPLPEPVMARVPAVSNTPTVSKPANVITSVAKVTAPVITDTITIAKPVPVPEIKPVVVKDTIAIAKPLPVPVPVQKTVVSQPPAKPALDTRLGSSTPQYDTWQKNNNGAGSVTTSPK